jgi:hypothetical protein
MKFVDPDRKKNYIAYHFESVGIHLDDFLVKYKDIFQGTTLNLKTKDGWPSSCQP